VTLPSWTDAMSDGCSVPEGLRPFFPNTPTVRACCIRHDRAYYLGGSRTDRLRADLQLATDWLATGEVPTWKVMQGLWAIRIGGGPKHRVPNVSWAFGGSVFKYTDHPAEEG